MILMKEAKQIKYDKAYLRMALEWGKLSYCERKQVGAIVVRDRMIISTVTTVRQLGLKTFVRMRRGIQSGMYCTQKRMPFRS